MGVWGVIGRDMDLVAIFDVFNQLFQSKCWSKEERVKAAGNLAGKLSGPIPVKLEEIHLSVSF